MTAIVRTYTHQGFVAAADGRQANADTGAVESDERQKIFPVVSTIGVFAISFCGAEGLAANESGEVLSFPRLIVDCAESLKSRKTNNAIGYAHRLSHCMNNAIRGLASGPIHSGKTAQPNMPDESGDTIFRLELDGYESNGRPVSIDMRFYHVDGELREPEVKLNNPLFVGFHRMYSPCSIIGDILFSGNDDQRLSAYRTPRKFAHEITLQEGIDRSKAYIAAHSDPEAITLDENCCAVGGHIHIATITPIEGFKWVISPVASSPRLQT